MQVGGIPWYLSDCWLVFRVRFLHYGSLVKYIFTNTYICKYAMMYTYPNTLNDLHVYARLILN